MNRAQLAWILALGLFAVPSISAQQGQRGPSANDSPRTLGKNTKVEAKTSDPISSQSNKIGDTIRGTIAKDVKDGTGAIIFPSGSPVVFEVVDIVAPDASHKEGALALAIQKVEVGGQSYHLSHTGGMAQGGKDSAQAGGVTVSQTNKQPGWSTEKGSKETKGIARVSGKVSKLGHGGQASSGPDTSMGTAGAAGSGAAGAGAGGGGGGGMATAELAVPSGTAVTFDFGDETVTISS